MVDQDEVEVRLTWYVDSGGWGRKQLNLVLGASCKEVESHAEVPIRGSLPLRHVDGEREAETQDNG